MTEGVDVARAGFERLMTVDQAAAVLGTGSSFVRRLVTQERIRCVHVGRYLRIPESGLADFIAEQTVNPAETRGKPEDHDD